MIRQASAVSLKTRLGLGAALLGAGTMLTAAILYFGMNDVARRLETALASEARMAAYSRLSTEVSTFLVVATEAVQAGQPTASRMDRVAPVANRIRASFGRLHAGVADAVVAALSLGLDEQSRYGTQSLGLARMEAMLDSTLAGLSSETASREELRATIDTFAARFDPLLSQAVNTEVLFRNSILGAIDAQRRVLSLTALAIGVATIAVVAGFYLGLVRPQFRRLDRLRDAALRIGREDFAVALPVTRRDEIGQLYAETNRMASALSERQAGIAAEWARLNETIAERTAALREANALLEEIDKNRRRLFADVSHELRTPLTVILTEAQLGRQGMGDAVDSFATIESRAARLNRRIDDLLRVAKSETGQLALDPTSISLARLAASITDEVRVEVENADMVLEPSEFPEINVVCDANWVRQVCVSLIRNAMRHARSGGLVRLDAVSDEGMAGFAVIDNGAGIADHDKTRVFDRFAQGAGANTQGFGVGLALARWVIEAQNGSMALESPVPRDAALGDAPGTKIALRLPRAAD